MLDFESLTPEQQELYLLIEQDSMNVRLAQQAKVRKALAEYGRTTDECRCVLCEAGIGNWVEVRP